MRASASYSALRTSLAACRGSSSTRTTNETGPSPAGSYPRSSSLRIHRGGLRTGGSPSMTRSTPSTIRPASRPGVTWTAHSARRSARSVEIPMSFALRGAPCGDWPHSTAPVRADNEDPSPGGRADHVPASLGSRVARSRSVNRKSSSSTVIASGKPTPCCAGWPPPSRVPGSLTRANVATALTGRHRLTRGLTGNLSQRASMIGRE